MNSRKWLLLLAGAILLSAHLIWLYGLTDDSFISFRYSRHLAQGHGLRWNIDEPPLEGYTNFLWVMLGTVAYCLFPAALPTVMSLLSMLFLLALLIIFDRMLRYRQKPAVASWPYLLLLIACGPLALWATSGLETSLFAFLLLLAFYCLLRHEQSTEERYYARFWAVASLVFLTRPDGFLLALVAAVYYLLVKKGLWHKKRVLPFILYYALPFILYNGWRIIYFHSLLPNTFFAKATGDSAGQLHKGLLYARDFSLAYLLPLLPVMIYLLLRQNKSGREKSPLFWLMLSFTALFVLYIVWVGGDYMANYRFFVPLLPLFYLMLAMLVEKKLASQKQFPAKVLLVLAAAVTLLPSTPLEKRIWGGNKTYHYGCFSGYQSERWYVNRYMAIGQLFWGLKRSPSDWLVVPAIGAIGYYSQMNILDYYGLTDYHIAHQQSKTFGANFPGHEKTDLDYILARQPTYLLGYKRFASHRAALDHPQFLEYYVQGNEQRKALLAANYRVRNVWLNDRRNNEQGYLSFLEIKR